MRPFVDGEVSESFSEDLWKKRNFKESLKQG